MSVTVLVTTAAFDERNFPEDWQVIYNPYGRKLTEDEILALVVRYQPIGIVAGVEPLTRRVLAQGGTLKVISRCGIGLDSVDLDAAKSLEIQVFNTPDAPTASVAELTLGLILCLARHISRMDSDIKSGAWKDYGGLLLKGKTVGIIGCGRIGSYVAKLVKAFGCHPLGYDAFIKEHDVCKMVEMDELLRNSDIVSLHLPYTPQNRHLIGAKQFALMKPGSLFINAARGGIVDEDALYDALVSEQIAGAAMDCFQEEPYAGKLAGLRNTVLTPHVGSGATEARRAMERAAVKNLVDHL
jgi:D-3-phosphoglycerate dehydrogenase / 2-oxoglutarate reductase